MGRGRISKISGPAVSVRGLDATRVYNRVRVGQAGLLGEVVRLHPDHCVIQVYEETTGLSIGEPVEDSGEPLTVELGPGLLSRVFDGIQRPLSDIASFSGPFIGRGYQRDPLSRDRKWPFVPRVKPGDRVTAGDILGTVSAEGGGIEHRVMVPPGLNGTVDRIEDGELTCVEPVAVLRDGAFITMAQRWPVRTPRPIQKKLPLDHLFFTGQRVLDTLFPLAVGGTVILPGGFGTGKTVVEQSLAKYAKADIVIYVGCGERGNEMAEVLEEFPGLQDPYTGRSLMDRTLLVVNTSNMPVVAREASIYTGITLAEYYRDMGYQVALLADSTSRWAEALREISSRLEEMPGEEGYPTTLGSRLAQFYERSGRVLCLGQDRREGAITLCAAVSPPGGDFSEPVTQSSLRVAGAMWALDFGLAHQRHYPAVHWAKSFSLYAAHLVSPGLERITDEFPGLRQQIFRLLQQEEEIRELSQLVGPDALQDREKMVLEFARILRDYYLRQNAYTPEDAFCPIEKQYGLLKVFFHFFDQAARRLQAGEALSEVLSQGYGERMEQLRETPAERIAERAREIMGGETCL